MGALMLACCAMAGLALDPVDDARARLDKAVEAHGVSLGKARKELDEAIANKLELVRKQGDREGVKRILAEQEAWQSQRKLPKCVSTLAYQWAADRADRQLVIEFDRAVREFTRLDRDDLADKAEKDRTRIFAPAKPMELPGVEEAKALHSLQAMKTARYAAALGGTAATPDVGFTDKPDDPAAQWLVIQSGEGFVRLMNRKTGKYLSPAVVQAGAGTDVLLKGPLKTAGHQSWKVVPADLGTVRLRHDRTGRYLGLDAQGKGLSLAEDGRMAPETLWKIARLPLK
jgi:hypothetical protein